MKVDTDSSVLSAVMSNQTFVTSHQSSSPPGYLFSMMGCWAAVSGVLGFTTNLLAIGTFLTVKKVKTKRFGACLQLKNQNYSHIILYFIVEVSIQLAADQPLSHRVHHLHHWQSCPRLQLIPSFMDVLRGRLSSQCFWNDVSR